MAPLGIIAGGGALPRALADAAQAKGRDVSIIAIEGAAETDTLGNHPYASFRIGAIGGMVKQLKKEGAEQVIMAGRVARPSLANLRPDLTATKLLAKLGSKILGGDDALLRALIDFLEKEGFSVVGVNDIAPQLLAPEGIIAAHTPDSQAQKDIERGAKSAHILGQEDIGQAVVIYNGAVLAAEALEGTERMIARAAKIRHDDAGGVLVKMCKPKQELRADLPTIGPDTITQAKAANLNGIAVEAGKTILLEREKLIAAANDARLFLCGVKHD